MAAVEEAPSVAPEASRIRPRRLFSAAGLVVVPLVTVAASYLTLYDDRPLIPAGADTPWYVWRAEVVAEGGLSALSEAVPPTHTEVGRVQPFRAGYPIVAGFLDSLGGVSPRELAYALPGLMGVLAALGAGAYAVAAARESRCAFPIYAVVVGASVNIVLTSVSHADNLIVSAVSVSAAAAALAAADMRASVLLPSVLIGGAAVVHWSVAAAFVGILLGLAVLLVPGSLRLWRSGTRPSRTPTGRVALAAGGGALAGAAGILLTPALPEFPRGWEESVDEKLRRDVPRFIVGAPFAALGAAGVASRDPNRRRAILLGILWALPAAGSVILLTVYDVPAHRILYVSLGVPLLAGAGITMLGRWLARVPPPPLGRVLAAAIVVALVAGGVLLGRGGWRELPPERIDQTTQAAALGRYLATVGTDRPVVVAVGLRTGQAPINLIRDGLHPRDIRRLHLYLGDVEALLAGRPTLEPGNAAFNEQSLAYWRAFRPVLDDRPIIASLEALDGPGGPAPGSTVAPGVRIAAGPPLPQHLSDVRLPPGPSIPRLSVILAGALVLFGAVGIGWTILLGPPGWTSRVALAPAVGLAALVLIGVLAGRLGVDHPPARPWIAAVTAAAGWGAAFLRRSRLRTQVESPGERAEVQA